MLATARETDESTEIKKDSLRGNGHVKITVLSMWVLVSANLFCLAVGLYDPLNGNGNEFWTLLPYSFFRFSQGVLDMLLHMAVVISHIPLLPLFLFMFMYLNYSRRVSPK